MKTIRNYFKKDRSINNDPEKLMLSKESHSNTEKTMYQCPMKCEGNKLYDAPGNCPVCNMKLEVADSNGTHEQHGHHHCC